MAAVEFNMIPPAEIALASNATKTVLQVVAAANQKVRVIEWGISFDGVSATEPPVQVEILRQTTAGTVTAMNSAATGVVKTRADSETVQTTGGYNATVEPTASDILEAIEVHPQTGYVKQYPFGREMLIGGGTRLGMRVITVAGNSAINCRPYFNCEE